MKSRAPFDGEELIKVLAGWGRDVTSGGHRKLPPGVAASWSSVYGVAPGEVAAAAQRDEYARANRALGVSELSLVALAASEAGVPRSVVEQAVTEACRQADGEGQRILLAAAALAAVREGGELGGKFLPATPSDAAVDRALEAVGVTAAAVPRSGARGTGKGSLPTRADGSIDGRAVQQQIAAAVMVAIGRKPEAAAAAGTAAPDGLYEALYGAGAGD